MRKKRKQDLGSQIRTARKAASLTQRQLADRIGCKRQNIGMIERNRRVPTLETLRRLTEVLGVSFVTDETGTQINPTR